MNAMGYNNLDGYLYAMGSAILALAAGLVRIDANGITTEVDGNPPRGLLLGSYDIGDVDDQGQYWATNGGIDWIQYDLNPTSATYGQVVTFGPINLLNVVGGIGDWSYIPSGGALFALGNIGAFTVLYKFDRSAKSFSSAAQYSTPTFAGLLGLNRAPVWTATYSGQNALYASESTSGQIWKFPIPSSGPPGTPTRVGGTAVGPTSVADGARCYNAPII